MNLIEQASALTSLTNSPLVIAGFFSVLGGVLLKITEHWLSKNANTRSDRQDFRAEIMQLNARVDHLEEENDKWRSRYYAEQEEVALLRTILIKNGLVPPAK